MRRRGFLLGVLAALLWGTSACGLFSSHHAAVRPSQAQLTRAIEKGNFAYVVGSTDRALSSDRHAACIARALDTSKLSDRALVEITTLDPARKPSLRVVDAHFVPGDRTVLDDVLEPVNTCITQPG